MTVPKLIIRPKKYTEESAVISMRLPKDMIRDIDAIVAIAAGKNYTVGLKADGTVVAVGSNDLGQCDVSDWTGIGMPTQTR